MMMVTMRLVVIVRERVKEEPSCSSWLAAARISLLVLHVSSIW